MGRWLLGLETAAAYVLSGPILKAIAHVCMHALDDRTSGRISAFLKQTTSINTGISHFPPNETPIMSNATKNHRMSVISILLYSQPNKYQF